MSALKNPTPPTPGKGPGPKLERILRPPAEGGDLSKEIAERVAVASTFDPAQPRKGHMARVIAVEWLRKIPTVDLDSLGLPLEIDREEPEEPEADPPPRPAPGKGLRLTPPEPRLPEGAYKNSEAEQDLISAMLADAGIIPDVFEVAPPEDFAYPQFRVIYSAIVAVHGRGETPDAPHVLEELMGSARLDLAAGPETVSRLAARKANPAGARDLAEIVRRCAELRRASGAIDRIRAEIVTGRRVDSETQDRLREIVERIGGRSDREPPAACVAAWPSAPGEAAWHGIAGEIVRSIEAQTEADPVALLFQFLVCFGSVVGRNAHWVVNATRHFTNLFLAIVGPSGVGSKGTGVDITEHLIGGIDHGWADRCVQAGLTTGEGLIEQIRDACASGKEPDLGVCEKRNLWSEAEFSQTIACMGRDKSILGEVLCKAWDGKPLRSASRQNPVKCREPHVSLLGQTTVRSIRSVLGENLKHSGFGNRILWVCSRRSKELPFGGDIHKIDLRKPLLSLSAAISYASAPAFRNKPFEMDKKARDIFSGSYGHLIRARAGGAAPLLDRAAAQVRRLALVYALLDKAKQIQAPHLLAALELWGYCERSAEFLFGDPEHDPTADKILGALREAQGRGLSQNEINRNLFGGRKSPEVNAALKALSNSGLVEYETEATKGRPTLIWFASCFSGVRAKRAKPPSSS